MTATAGAAAKAVGCCSAWSEDELEGAGNKHEVRRQSCRGKERSSKFSRLSFVITRSNKVDSYEGQRPTRAEQHAGACSGRTGKHQERGLYLQKDVRELGILEEGNIGVDSLAAELRVGHRVVFPGTFSNEPHQVVRQRLRHHLPSQLEHLLSPPPPPFHDLSTLL